jgi:flagellar basal-body rod protein FlgB
MLSDLPLLTAIKGRLAYHQNRQKVLAENVANADSPGFKPRDLKPFDLTMAALRQADDGQPARTQPGHLLGSGGSGATGTRRAGPFETRPSGNAVSLEEEMMKLSQNNSDYQLAATLYGKSLSYLRLALGKRA